MSSTLYRKYRPSTFEGIIGQQHITKTLQNQLHSGRIGHAYLFCGSRGVGKTSLARIFSHAINCLDPKTAPCLKCEACLNGQGEGNIDIIEIDAASNNGVDDARDLRDKVKYPPVLGKYKVYIIDEVHMLTGSAFNALLKTLEEPPLHAVFILATTEPHKLPATILSRCMRFDFRLVSMEMLCELLSDIFKKEKKEYQDEALRMIAAAAEGSVRDALSIADTCISASDFIQEEDEKNKGVLTALKAMAILGLGSKKTEELFFAIASGDIAQSLTAINELYNSGKSMNVIAKEIAVLARDLMVAKVAPSVLKTTLERLSFLTEKAKEYTIEGLSALVQLFSEMDSVLRYSVNPRIAMEAALIRAVKLYSLDLVALDERILRLENKLESLTSGGFNNNLVNPLSKSTIKTEEESVAVDDSVASHGEDDGYYPTPPPQDDYPVLSNSFDGETNNSHPKSPENSDFDGAMPTKRTTSKPNQALSAVRIWGKMITYFRQHSTPGFTQLIGRQNPSKVFLKNGELKVVASKEDFLQMCDESLQETLSNALNAEGLTLKVTVEKDSQDIDMEKEVNTLINEFGQNKVNIIK